MSAMLRKREASSLLAATLLGQCRFYYRVNGARPLLADDVAECRLSRSGANLEFEKSCVNSRAKRHS